MVEVRDSPGSDPHGDTDAGGRRRHRGRRSRAGALTYSALVVDTALSIVTRGTGDLYSSHTRVKIADQARMRSPFGS
jgi:hypothetical protein